MSKKTAQPKRTNQSKSYEEALLPDKPSPKHTVLIICKGESAGGERGCKRQRWCKPQDAWQVRLCLPCRDARDAAKAKQSITKLKAKVESKRFVESVRAYIPRLIVYKFIWPTAAEMSKAPRMRRVWP